MELSHKPLALALALTVAAAALKVILSGSPPLKHGAPPRWVRASPPLKLVVPESARRIVVRRGSRAQFTVAVISPVSDRAIRVRLIAYREEISPHALFLIRLAERARGACGEVPEPLARAVRGLLPEGVEVAFSRGEVLVPPGGEAEVAVTVSAAPSARVGTYKICIEAIARAGSGYAGHAVRIEVTVKEAAPLAEGS